MASKDEKQKALEAALKVILFLSVFKFYRSFLPLFPVRRLNLRQAMFSEPFGERCFALLA